jgi:hypothetical protein
LVRLAGSTKAVPARVTLILAPQCDRKEAMTGFFAFGSEGSFGLSESSIGAAAGVDDGRSQHGHGQDLVGESGPEGHDQQQRRDAEGRLHETQDCEDSRPARGC